VELNLQSPSYSWELRSSGQSQRPQLVQSQLCLAVRHGDTSDPGNPNSRHISPVTGGYGTQAGRGGACYAGSPSVCQVIKACDSTTRPVHRTVLQFTAPAIKAQAQFPAPRSNEAGSSLVLGGEGEYCGVFLRNAGTCPNSQHNRLYLEEGLFLPIAGTLVWLHLCSAVR
jgi:hypothetical protein